jgi:hypothetical protein
MSAMTIDDLKSLTVRWLERSGIDYLTSEDEDSFVVPSEDDVPVYIGFLEAVDSSDNVWPVLLLNVPVLQDIARDSIDTSHLLDLTGDYPVGSLELHDDVLAVVDTCVGWPGNEELAVTISCLLASRAGVSENLTGVFGSPPVPYSELSD